MSDDPIQKAKERSDKFYLDEYKSLRQETLSTIAESRSVERFAIPVIGGVYAWLVGQEVAIIGITAGKTPPVVIGSGIYWLLMLGWLVPFGIAIYGLRRSKREYRELCGVVSYVRALEAHFRSKDQNEPQGYEHSVEDNYNRERELKVGDKKERDLKSCSDNDAIGIWYVVLAITTVATIIRALLRLTCVI